MLTRDDWSSALATCGIPSATITLTQLTAASSADSWASQDIVSTIFNVHCNCTCCVLVDFKLMFPSKAMDVILSFLPQLSTDADVTDGSMYGMVPTIGLDNVDCTGDETALSQCSANVTIDPSCTITTVVGLVCRDERTFE